jgi:hypothetical protein
VESRLVHLRRHDALGRQYGLGLGNDGAAIIQHLAHAGLLREGGVALLLDLGDVALSGSSVELRQHLPRYIVRDSP